MSKEKYKPAKRTIGPAFRVKQWSLGKFATCKYYRISKKFKITKLHGAAVYIIGPDSWEKAKQIGNVLVVKNHKFTVRLVSLATGLHSEIYKPGYTFVVEPKHLVEVY